MEQALKYVIDKSERAVLVTGERTAVKAVEAKSENQNSKGNNQFKCPYCSGAHKATECNKYKTSNAQMDLAVYLHLCYNCLKVGHSVKTCKIQKTCFICNSHHHSSLCNRSNTAQKQSNVSATSGSHSSARTNTTNAS